MQEILLRRLYHKNREVVALAVGETTIVGDKEKTPMVNLFIVNNGSVKTMKRSDFLRDFKLVQKLDVE